MCNTAGIDNQRASGANIAANCRTIFLNNLPAPGGYNCCVSFPAAFDILRSAVDIGACGYAIIINILNMKNILFPDYQVHFTFYIPPIYHFSTTSTY